MKIFITGVAGFVGSCLAEEFLKCGHKVCGISTVSGVDNFSFGSHANLKRLNHKGFNFKRMDVCDNSLENEMKGSDIVFHLAAYKIPRYGDTYTSLMSNVFGAHNVLKSSKGIPIIMASTSDVYGKQSSPFKECDDLVIGSPECRRWSYAASKIIDEHMTIAFNEKFKQKYNIIRFFNIYGKYCALDWTGGAVPQIIGRVIQNKTVEIHGDGKQTRSYIYIDDIIRALIGLVESGKWNEIINIGSTHSISVNKLVNIIYDIVGIDKSRRKIKYIPYKNFFGKYEDVRFRKPDISKINKLIGWKPEIKLRDGLKRTIEWQNSLKRSKK